MVLEIPHFVIDALAHCYSLVQSICLKKENTTQMKLIGRKLAFFITAARKMESEQYWLLHQEVMYMLRIECRWS